MCSVATKTISWIYFDWSRKMFMIYDELDKRGFGTVCIVMIPFL